MIGETISHYKILEKLGEGGMGVVYKAEDTKLKRTVALKFLPPELIRNSEAKERFIHESQTAAALNHPNICTIHEIDESESPTGVGMQSFIAMECVEGQSLKERIESGPIKYEEALTIIVQVAEGLREAHDRGIVHRDIKSANIMVTTKGQAKIMDFGLAKLAGQTKLTKAGTTLGTVAYMSPEQAKGGKVDSRTDIWSLGVVFYEMLTGELPFRGEYEQAVIYSILNVDPDPIAGIPLECERIVNSCLKKDSEERYSSTADLQEDLKLLEQEISSGKVPVRKRTTTAPGHFPKLLRKPAVLIGGVILALLLLFFLSSGRRIVKKWLGTEVKNLAMLPFTVMVGDSTDQAFCDGMVESLTNKLTQLEQFERSLWVVPSLDVRKDEITSVNEAKRSMSGVNLVITGSFRRMGDMIVLKMNLIDTKTLRQQNSLEIRDHIANISTWQDDVAIKLINLLDIELKPEIRRVLTTSGTSISDVYECYLQGLGYLQNEEKERSLDAAIRMFQRAIEQDSLYALAYAGLGKAYWLKYKLTKIDHWIEKAQTTCNRTIQIDNRLVPVRITLGEIYKETGRFEEAIEEYQQALQVDPVNSIAYLELAAAYEEIEKLTEAEEIYKKVIELRPSYSSGYNWLGYYYWRYGHHFEAEKMFLKATELAPEQIMIYNNLG
ncbi:MAG: protein kinase, partial [Candidatus Hodarchaeota archaeon]